MRLPKLSPDPRLRALLLGAALPLAHGCALTPGPLLLERDTSLERESEPRAPDRNISPPVTPGNRSAPLAHVGKASWYGPGFGGKKTASGAVFDDDKFTAAHKTLPLGSRVKVTNLTNGKAVEVEINDRGPYAGNRIIDLSRAAARAIGMVADGVVQVRIEPLATMAD
jgi:rare lipoprotein A